MSALQTRLRDANIRLPELAPEQLARYNALLLEWNRVHSLTRAHTPNAVDDNLFDSLYPLRFLAPFTRALDIGSGAGFPAIPLAIALPDAQFVLCESNRKKAAFLHYACSQLGLSHVRVAAERVESLQSPPFDLILSRAVGETRLLIDLSAHLSDAATTYLLYKGERAESEARDHPHARIITRGERRYLLIPPEASGS